MESTSLDPCATPETTNSDRKFIARKRPQKAMEGVGHILMLWVHRSYGKGLLPSLRSLPMLMTIADAVDADGRWCYLLLETMVERSHGLLSLSSAKRALKDLMRAGLIGKLDRRQTLAFFARDIAAGRSIHHLPCVWELLIPAEDFPEPVLAEINAFRIELGEEPITPENRPKLTKPVRVQNDPTPRSDRPTDLFPEDHSTSETPSSVRGCVGTGEQTRQTPPSGPHARIARIPDRFLFDPVADRRRLGRAVDDLARQGLGVSDLVALFRGMEQLTRPFPALMRRLRSLEAAQAFLNGSLGRGVTPDGLPAPAWPSSTPEGGDPLDHPPRFKVDARGTALGTCPVHHSIRNVPGGFCSGCGHPCRSVPGEVVHPPVRPRPELEPGPEPEPEPEPGGEGHRDPVEVPDVDPELMERMRASFANAGSTPRTEPEPAPAYPPARRRIIDDLRQRLAA